MTAPTREQMTQWALDCGLVEQRDVDNRIIDALFDDLWRFAEIDLRRFAELAYAAGQTAEREACAEVCDNFEHLNLDYMTGAGMCANLIRKRVRNENIS